MALEKTSKERGMSKFSFFFFETKTNDEKGGKHTKNKMWVRKTDNLFFFCKFGQNCDCGWAYKNIYKPTHRMLFFVMVYAELLQNGHVYTQLCRLLVGIKNNYQLDDLCKVGCYQQWVQQAAEFTMLSFNSIQVIR